MRTLSTNNSVKFPIKYLVISDIHLFNSRNKTSSILSNLVSFFDNFRDTSSFVDLDIIFIAGDLFDTLIDMSGSEMHEIQIWAGRLMYFCAKHDIRLRVLEGTPSHDWKQSKMFNTVAQLTEHPLNFRYIESLEIEHIEDLGLNILYVPDEWSPTTENTLKQVKELISGRGLLDVDIAIMHGAFSYQMKHIPGKHQTHDEAEYLSLVKYFISIGHIHSFSVCDRILAQGSFDRLSHGEEEAKGGVVITLNPPNENSFTFIENKNAKGFKTVTLKSKDIDKCYSQIDKVVSKMKVDDYVRIKAAKDHPLYLAFDDLKSQYPMFNFSKTILTEDNEVKPLAFIDTEKTYIALSITKDNIIPMLLKEVIDKTKLSDKQNSLLINILEGAL